MSPPLLHLAHERGGVVLTYTIRRLLQIIPILLGATMVIFLVIKMAPGDPFSGMINPHIDQSKIAEERHRLCLDCPLPQQYAKWFTEVMQGNLGTSIRFKEPVSDIIGAKLGPTLALGISTELIVFLLGIPIGIISARRQHSWLDNVVTLFAFGGLSIPAFFFGLLLLKGFALGGLHLFPSSGYMTPGSTATGLEHFFDVGHHLVLPALALGITGIAGLTRYVRSSMLEVLRQDYIRTAQAKGLAERVVTYKHALRNALIPVITILGLDLPVLVGGAIITESIFIWPGIGRLTYTSLLERDYPVLMALNLMFALLTMVGSLLADLGYAAVDPRIRYD